MITINEILDIASNGKNTIKERKELDEIVGCVDDFSGYFVGSRRADSLISKINAPELTNGIKKAFDKLKLYEDKIINGEELSDASVRVIVFDANKAIKESYDAIEKNKRVFENTDKDAIAKLYSTVLFETETICRKHNIPLENIIKYGELFENISDDMAKIVNEVF